MSLLQPFARRDVQTGKDEKCDRGDDEKHIHGVVLLTERSVECEDEADAEDGVMLGERLARTLKERVEE